MIALIVSYNTLPFLKMAVLSARRHIVGLKQVWVWDNGSADGSAERAVKNTDRVFTGINAVHGHGKALNEMVQQCEEDGVIITLDSDVEIVGEIIPVNHFNGLSKGHVKCAYADFDPLPEVDSEGRRLASRVNPALALFRNKTTASHSFIPQWVEGRFYDVGAMHKQALGNTAIPSWALESSAVHYGNSTWPANGVTDPNLVSRVEENRKLVMKRLSAPGYEQ